MVRQSRSGGDRPDARHVKLALPPVQVLIGGRWQDGAELFPVKDKYSGALLAEVHQPSADQIAAAAHCAAEAFATGAPEPVERARILRRAAELVLAQRRRILDLMIAETGFTAADAGGDLDRTAVTLQLCAEEATRIVGETVAFAASPGQHDRLGFTIRMPLGIVCCITPFNSPLNVVAHKVAPALAAGNSVILKPSPLTPLTAALFCEILLEAGLPPAQLSLLNGVGDRVGSALLARQEIAFFSFTGSTRVGRLIRDGAGLRPVQLELGSIASTIICADADLEKAVPKVANAAFRKAGQVCTSTQRLYVDERIAPEMLERLAAAARSMPAGDPRNPATKVGPMISEAAAQRAESWIEEARRGQARIVCGGERAGPVLSPTILAEVSSGMRVVDEEIFAPCVSVLPFSTLDEAVHHANNTPYGLSAGIFTRDVGQAVTAARRLRFGSVHINEASSARADGMPFGGVKESGIGHEGPKYAIRELTEERLVTLNT